MYLCRIMLLGDMIYEANTLWPQLSARHPAIKHYRDCQDFFDAVSKEPRETRDAMFAELLEDCVGGFDNGDITLLIILCYPELRSILGWKTTSKMDDEERLQVWLSMVFTFVEALSDPVEPKTTIIEIRKAVNNAAEKRRRHTNADRMQFSLLGFELDENFEAPESPNPLTRLIMQDCREVWEIIQSAVPSPQELAWVQGLIAEMTNIPGIEMPSEIPKLSSSITGRIRDVIAKAILECSPRLEAFVRLKEPGRHRRNYKRVE